MKIIHHFPIKSTPLQAYDAIASIKGLKNWWSDTIEGNTEVDKVIDFKFIEVFNPQMRVEASVPGKEVRWRCIGGHEPWQDNTITFQFIPTSQGCELHFVHAYASPIPEDQYGYYNFNWAYYLNSLKLYCETGAGKPHKVSK